MSKPTLLSVFERTWLTLCLGVLAIAVREVELAMLNGSLSVVQGINFAVFAIYWLRFYFGNLNYILFTYKGKAKGSAVMQRAACDLVLLLLHMSALLLAATSTAHSTSFADSIVLLNLTDCWWLLYEPRCWPTQLQIAGSILAGAYTPSMARTARKAYPPRNWTWNNLATAVALHITKQTVGDESCLILAGCVLAAALINTYFDVKTTRMMF